MHSELEKIDLIRARTGVSYREAKKALDEAGGDPVQALINLEERGKANFSEKVQSRGHEVLENLRAILQRGQETKIKVKRGDRVVFELPASAGAVGLLAALASSELALLGALGAVTAMANKYSLEIERREKGETEEQHQEKKGTFTFESPPLNKPKHN